MKIFLIPALLISFVLLTGCNKEMENGKTDRHIETLRHQMELEEKRLASMREIAKGQWQKELVEQKQFYEYMGPLLKFGFVVLLSYGLVAFFRFMKFAQIENSENRRVQLETVREAEATARHKYELACTLVLTPEFFAQLSDEQKTQTLKRIEYTPPSETSSYEPPPPLHQRIYDDLKGWAQRRTGAA